VLTVFKCWQNVVPLGVGKTWFCYILGTAGGIKMGPEGYYVSGYGKFFGMGHFGAALECGTEMAGSKFQRVITRLLEVGGLKAWE